jgi:hypothetical protein
MLKIYDNKYFMIYGFHCMDWEMSFEPFVNFVLIVFLLMNVSY